MNKQMIGYNFASLRTLGDQPGARTPRYFSSWQTLPEGAYIPLNKFSPRTQFPVLTITNAPQPYYIMGFYATNTIPFPSTDIVNGFAGKAAPQNQYVTLPFVAFNYLGQLVDGQEQPTGVDEVIPLEKGAIGFSRTADRTPRIGIPTITPQPPGNATNAFDVVRVEWLTGRAHAERLEIK